MTPTEPRLRAVLAELRARGEVVSIQDLARRVTASDAEVPLPLARRLVAAALEYAPDELGETLQGDGLRSAAERRVAGVPIAQAHFSVVDLETTGLSARDSEILEIGAVRVSRLVLAAEFECLARPSRAISRRISEITGIDDALVADAPPLAEALARFRRWVEEASAAAFVAHNASFDSRFMWAGLARSGLAPLGVPVLCTLRLARRLLPQLDRYSLDHLSAHFGVSNAARHRALGDARATARVLVELLARAPALGLRTVGDLLDLQDRRPPRRRSKRFHHT